MRSAGMGSGQDDDGWPEELAPPTDPRPGGGLFSLWHGINLPRTGEGHGHFATGRLAPRPASLFNAVALTIFLAGLAVGLSLYLASDGVATPWGGISGTVQVNRCDLPSRAGDGCTGQFTSDDGEVEIGRVIVNDDRLVGQDVQVGDQVRARVGGPGAEHAFTEGGVAWAIPVLGAAIAWFSTAWALVAWPLRALIHRRRPDVWPRWVTGPHAPTRWPARPGKQPGWLLTTNRALTFEAWFMPRRHPGWLTVLLRVARITALLLALLFAVMVVLMLLP